MHTAVYNSAPAVGFAGQLARPMEPARVLSLLSLGAVGFGVPVISDLTDATERGVDPFSAPATADADGIVTALATAATLSAWIQPSSVSTTRSILALETNQGSNSQPYSSLAMSVENGTLRGWVTTTNATGAGQSTAAGLISVGAWHHVGVSFESSVLTLWVDGLAVGALSASGSTIHTAGASERWTVGDMTGPSERLNGRVADVRVYQSAKASAWWRETHARGVGLYRGQ